MKIVAIQNYGSSGTTLLHSLLDGHPRVFCMPGLVGNGYFGEWASSIAPLDFNLMSIDDGITKITNIVVNFFSSLWDHETFHNKQMALYQLGDGLNENPFVDVHDFATLLKIMLTSRVDMTDISTLSRNEFHIVLRREVLIAAHQAYSMLIWKKIRGKDIIVFPAHSSHTFEMAHLVQSFGDVKFVYMIRDVPGNLDSCVKTYKWTNDTWVGMYWTDILHSATRQFLLDFHPFFEIDRPVNGVFPYAPSLVSNSRAVRLESLHAAPEPTMRAVADWIGLEWHPCLLESTFAGKKWWNQARLKRVSGFSPDIVTTFKRTTPFDRWRMARLATPVRTAFGYRKSRPWDGLVDLGAILASMLPFDIERRDDTRVRNLVLTGRILDRIQPAASRGRHEKLALRLRRIHCRKMGSLDGLRGGEGSAGMGGPLDRPIRRFPRLCWAGIQIVGGLVGYLRTRVLMIKGAVWLRRRRRDFVPLLPLETNCPDSRSPE